MQDKQFTFFQHLEELRNRVLKSLIFVVVSACLFYNFIPLILPYLLKPVGNLVFIHPCEAFTAKITIAFFGGLFLASPVIIYQIWRFLSCALTKKEKKYTSLFGMVSFLLFVAGCLFGYFLVLPVGFKFLISFASELIRPMITVSKYISFAAGVTLVFGAVFQFPLIILFLTKIGLVSPRKLSKRRKEAIVGMFIVAAFFTPPDIVTQILLAVPLLVLYETSILVSRLVENRGL
jgi:sec-independent protein translocase protein TatC